MLKTLSLFQLVEARRFPHLVHVEKIVPTCMDVIENGHFALNDPIFVWLADVFVKELAHCSGLNHIHSVEKYLQVGHGAMFRERIFQKSNKCLEIYIEFQTPGVHYCKFCFI